MFKKLLISFSLWKIISISYAQSPEISLREFASGQIKKGVRTLGMGGDGATSGNYSMVYRDSGTALIDAGVTDYPNGNSFGFTAIAATTHSLWHGLTFYGIALSQNATDISTTLKFPAAGKSAVPVHGAGSNAGFFIKAAMPFGKGFAVGVILSYENSQFNGVADNSTAFVRYQTSWKPSAGFGITYEPTKRILVGFRALFNQDGEKRIDNLGVSEGLNLTQEFRLGVSYLIWKGGLIDIGGNLRHRTNDINNVDASSIKPNIGFEQNFLNRHLALRTGVDESSLTAGFSLRFHPVSLDAVYVNNLGSERIGTLFGTNSNSFIATLVFKY